LKRLAATLRRFTLKRLIAEAAALVAALMLGFPTAMGTGKELPVRGLPAQSERSQSSHESSEERSEGEGEERSNERTGSDEDPVVWQLYQARSRHAVRHDGRALYGSAPDTHHNKTNPEVPSTSSAAHEFRNGIGCPLRC